MKLAVASVMFRLIYTCRLHHGDALSLKNENVNLKQEKYSLLKRNKKRTRCCHDEHNRIIKKYCRGQEIELHTDEILNDNFFDKYTIN